MRVGVGVGESECGLEKSMAVTVDWPVVRRVLESLVQGARRFRLETAPWIWRPFYFLSLPLYRSLTLPNNWVKLY